MEYTKLPQFDEFKKEYAFIENDLERIVAVYGKNIHLAVTPTGMIGFDSDKMKLQERTSKQNPLIINMGDYLNLTERSNYTPREHSDF